MVRYSKRVQNINSYKYKSLVDHFAFEKLKNYQSFVNFISKLLGVLEIPFELQ